MNTFLTSTGTWPASCRLAPHMGWEVFRRLVSAGDALPHRAHEEDRPVTARASRTDPQLFPRSEAALQRGCRGPEQQSQTHNEKILRIPHLPLSRTRPLSLTWQITGAGINPRFFLTNHILQGVLLRHFEPPVLLQCERDTGAAIRPSASDANSRRCRTGCRTRKCSQRRSS